MCSVTVVRQKNVRREGPAVEESYLSREYFYVSGALLSETSPCPVKKLNCIVV